MKNIFSKLCIGIFIFELFINCNEKLNTDSSSKNYIKILSKGYSR